MPDLFDCVTYSSQRNNIVFFYVDLLIPPVRSHVQLNYSVYVDVLIYIFFFLFSFIPSLLLKVNLIILFENKIIILNSLFLILQARGYIFLLFIIIKKCLCYFLYFNWNSFFKFNFHFFFKNRLHELKRWLGDSKHQSIKMRHQLFQNQRHVFVISALVHIKLMETILQHQQPLWHSMWTTMVSH